MATSEAGSRHTGGHSQDPLGEAVAAFLSDLLNGTEVTVHTDTLVTAAAGNTLLPPEPVVGADGRVRQFSVHSRSDTAAPDRPSPFPRELDDLPGAALRALGRMTSTRDSAQEIQPSLARALHDVVVVEVLADRLIRRLGDGTDRDAVVEVVAATLDYAIELAATRVEGRSVTHGVVLCADLHGREAVRPRVAYPGRLPTRKRTPLLFDGTEAVLAVTADGAVVGELRRSSLPPLEGRRDLGDFDALLGIDGSLTAASSAAFRGVSVNLRSDRSIWIFDDGEPLFIRRTHRWKSIAARAFAETIATLGRMPGTAAGVLSESVLRASIQGTGALFAVASDSEGLDDLIAPKDMVSAGPTASSHRTVDDDLHTLLRGAQLRTPSGLARLARLDGATVLSRTGELLAYGAIVRSADSRGEGARTAAARTLSLRTNVAISVSQDGPVTVFHHGEVVLELL